MGHQEEHERWMRRCLALAAHGLGTTYPNPLVGAVLVHAGKIIGEGYHHKAGGNHAEIQAFSGVKDAQLFQESTLYVNLEPCAHFGKTPPCALKIIELGIPKVVVGCLDFNPLVGGKGIALLENAGIQVITGVLEREARALNRRFFTFHQQKRPYIILKWAQTQDGFLDAKRASGSFQISSPRAKQWMHRLRAQENAILVGTKTALLDNPELTARAYYGENPIRILIDQHLRIPKNFSIFDAQSKTLVFNGLKQEQQDQTLFHRVDFSQELLPQIIEELYRRQVQSVVVEGGRMVLEQFLQHRLWDEIFVLQSKNVFAGEGTPAPTIGIPAENVFDLSDDRVFAYRQKPIKYTKTDE